MEQDISGPVSGLSDAQAGERLEALGYNHYRVRSALVEARQSASVTLERHLLTLMSDGFRIETLARQEDVVPVADPPVIPAEQDQAWQDMVALGQELQGEPAPGGESPWVLLGDGPPDPELDAEFQAEALHARAVEELARTFQTYIGGDSPSLERTEHFTIDGAAYYPVTPAQWRELMALAPNDIIALNDEGANVPPWPPAPPVPYGTPSQQDLGEWPAGMHEAHCGPKSERDDRCSLGCDCPCHRGEPVPPLASGLTGDAAVGTLRTLGYDEEQANRYVADATTHGMSFLPRDHTVWRGQQEGTFDVYTKVPHPGRPGVHISGPAQPGTRLASYAGNYDQYMTQGTARAKTVLEIADPAPDDIRLSDDWAADQLTGKFLDAVHRARLDGQATRILEDGQVLAVIVPRSRRDGPELCYATGRGDSLPEMRSVAMAKARRLYGPDAELRVDHADPVRTYGTGFTCCFAIRCLNFPGEAL